MFSPGAATSTHGPARLKSDADPSAAAEPTVSTKSSYHAGLATTDTASPPAASRGFWPGHCPAAPTLPAALTTTVFVTSTA
ncbi:hypothetical protein MCHUDSM44219_03505 [Mycolicibacterium chubuense]|uniref:Uncharacterized protein n=1 Tax=Mycolicibacterium chubuense TaxID=1800 RepID=A0A0J6W493_MYCCU|nr:hypothetical protein MCHUDSM44219_03505 [Mycolicibacterium chubuense]